MYLPPRRTWLCFCQALREGLIIVIDLRLIFESVFQPFWGWVYFWFALPFRLQPVVCWAVNDRLSVGRLLPWSICSFPSTAASFRLPVWHAWTWNWKKMHIVSSRELVESHMQHTDQCTSSGPHQTVCGAYQAFFSTLVFVSPGSWECWQLCVASKSLSFCLAPWLLGLLATAYKLIQM